MSKKKVAFVFGTRPELIKMVPMFFEAWKTEAIQPILCSTGQHRDMLQGLYDFFGIKPDIDFGLMRMGQSLAGLHADILKKMEEVFEKYRPDYVVVQGDTTTAHAAAMAAFYNKIPVAHVEAGLRTYDIDSPFPEEMNRRAISLVSRYHFCPTTVAATNLSQEKLDASSRVVITGNTSIDTLNLTDSRLQQKPELLSKILKEFAFLKDRKFILSTVHRRENFGSAQQGILKAWLDLVKQRNVDILFPVHPNPEVRKSVQAVFGPEMGKTVFWKQDLTNESHCDSRGKIILTEPLDYPVLVYLMKQCHFVMSDSGGLQEEAPTFSKKVLVLRESTERPEGIAAGFSTLVGTNSDRILEEGLSLVDQDHHWYESVPVNPYGDGFASERIVQSLSGVQSSALESDFLAAGLVIPQASPTLK